VLTNRHIENIHKGHPHFWRKRNNSSSAKYSGWGLQIMTLVGKHHMKEEQH